jgi:hypothetical protein
MEAADQLLEEEWELLASDLPQQQEAGLQADQLHRCGIVGDVWDRTEFHCF